MRVLVAATIAAAPSAVLAGTAEASPPGAGARLEWVGGFNCAGCAFGGPGGNALFGFGGPGGAAFGGLGLNLGNFGFGGILPFLPFFFR